VRVALTAALDDWAVCATEKVLVHSGADVFPLTEPV
jgi:hypothetical protein